MLREYRKRMARWHLVKTYTFSIFSAFKTWRGPFANKYHYCNKRESAAIKKLSCRWTCCSRSVVSRGGNLTYNGDPGVRKLTFENLKMYTLGCPTTPPPPPAPPPWGRPLISALYSIFFNLALSRVTTHFFRLSNLKLSWKNYVGFIWRYHVCRREKLANNKTHHQRKKKVYV